MRYAQSHLAADRCAATLVMVCLYPDISPEVPAAPEHGGGLPYDLKSIGITQNCAYKRNIADVDVVQAYVTCGDQILHSFGK